MVNSIEKQERGRMEKVTLHKAFDKTFFVNYLSCYSRSNSVLRRKRGKEVENCMI